MNLMGLLSRNTIITKIEFEEYIGYFNRFIE